MKRIVCDIDDTISFTTNRDWENAKPNQDVIEKINSLYDQGWEIYLVTARGSLSCATREDAEKKYRAQIENWLERHSVKYTLLSFEKYLAAYYVDDKSITPEEFVKLDIRELKSGWSGARVELRDGRVYKTADNSIEAAAWYDIAEHFFATPRIYSLIGNTLCMEYIEPDENYALQMNDIINIIMDMSNIPYIGELPTTINDVKYYGNRLENHWLNLTRWYSDYCCKSSLDFGQEFEQNMDRVIPMLNSLIREIKNKECFPWNHLESANSFCHGDFSVDNILSYDCHPVLIDPIYEPKKTTWSSWLLDASKMLHSLRRYNRMTEYMYLYNNLPTLMDIPGFATDDIKHLLIKLEITQFLRVFKYAPDSEKPGIIKHIKTLFDQ